MYLDGNGDVRKGASLNGPLASGIPGQPAALVHLAGSYGTLPLKTLLQPAIDLALEGFAVTPHYQRMAQMRLEALRASPDAARIFLRQGEVPPLGHLIKQPELADMLALLAREGHSGFYRGEFAKKLVNSVTKAGGIWSMKDLKEYRVVERAPVYARYRDMDIVSAAPPSSGGVALATMLHILDQYSEEELKGVQGIHLTVEAMRLAYADRARYLGDPDFVEIPQQRLVSPAYGRELKSRINKQQAGLSTTLKEEDRTEGRDTTHYSIIDQQGNYVAATLSINYPFGSGHVAEGTGILLNDEMDDFSIKPGVPNAYGLVGAEANAIEPGKRMLSSMSPTFVRSPNGVAVVGTPGGSRIITMVLHAILDAARGNGPTSWVSRPRFHHQYLPNKIFHEPDTFSVEEINALRTLGHKLEEQQPYGNMQAVWWDKQNNRVEAANDPRVEGQATVMPIEPQ
jgi:gamma-glutamyltranspeptidase/glutathione hydrolase